MVTVFLMWDIRRGQEEQYERFVVEEFLPAVVRLGLTPRNALAKVAGEGPQILGVVSADNQTALHAVWQSAEWQKLQRKLLGLVTNFRTRQVSSGRHVQM